MKKGKIIIFSAPSGTGKSTIIKQLMPRGLNLAFSISATSRPPRGQEKDGVEYYFLSPDEFREKIEQDEFIEYEEVYKDRYYGTLRGPVEKQMDEGYNVIMDIDVKGACNIKKQYGSRALMVFIQPPSLDTLRQRLTDRGTEKPEIIEDRMARAEYELSFAPRFDTIIINDQLDTAVEDAYREIKKYLEEN